MPGVPQIVRERLRAAASAANHPDADVLTAFAEHSLPNSERTIVLEHLSRCGDCRDVVALALPQIEVVAPAQGVARRQWLTWPALRWGFAVAGVLAIATLGMLRYQRHLQPQIMAAKQSSSPEALAARLEAPASAPPRAAAGAERSNKVVATSPMRGLPSGVAGSKSPAGQELVSHARPSVRVPQTGRAVIGGPVGAAIPQNSGMMVQSRQQNAYHGQALVARSATKQNGAVLTANDAAAQAAEAPPLPGMSGENRPAQLQSQSSEAEPANGDDSLRIGKAKPPDVPRWAISATGALERSFDEGSTWQDVDVTAASMPVISNSSTPEAASGTAAKKNNHRIALGREGFAPVFRAVAANGTEVWAGGNNGVLYHSIDAGNRWTRVVPIAGDSTLTSDIISLDLPDALHCRITTSTAQVWITGDDGQTWQKQ
jgi:Photosynthesis system II assembly factor YCF48